MPPHHYAQRARAQRKPLTGFDFAHQVYPGVFILDVIGCRPSLATVSHGTIECVAYDHPTWRDGRPCYRGDFALIKPGDLLILVRQEGAQVFARVLRVIFDADEDCEPVCILLGEDLER